MVGQQADEDVDPTGRALRDCPRPPRRCPVGPGAPASRRCRRSPSPAPRPWSGRARASPRPSYGGARVRPRPGRNEARTRQHRARSGAGPGWPAAPDRCRTGSGEVMRSCGDQVLDGLAGQNPCGVGVGHRRRHSLTGPRRQGSAGHPHTLHSPVTILMLKSDLSASTVRPAKALMPAISAREGEEPPWPRIRRTGMSPPS